MTDKELEGLWIELEDVLFVEDEDSDLILSDSWLHFEKGANRDTIWEWFDYHHSKGVAWLLYDFEF